MATGVDLSFLTSEFISENRHRADEQQRELLKRATAEKPDEAAARKLLIYFVQGGSAAFAPDVWETMEERMRDFVRVLIASTAPGATFNAHPLKLFDSGASRAPGTKGGSKNRKRTRFEAYQHSEQMTALVEAQYDLGNWLTADDLKEALTTQWEAINSGDRAKPIRWPDRSHYPETVLEIEERLVNYLCLYKYKGVHPTVALHYAHDSFERLIPWAEPAARATYPKEWGG